MIHDSNEIEITWTTCYVNGTRSITLVLETPSMKILGSEKLTCLKDNYINF